MEIHENQRKEYADETSTHKKKKFHKLLPSFSPVSICADLTTLPFMEMPQSRPYIALAKGNISGFWSVDLILVTPTWLFSS